MPRKPIKSYIFITIVITLYLLLVACATVEPHEATKTSIPPAPEAIRTADQAFAQRQDLGKLREAIALLSKLRVENARIFDVEWRFAKYNYFLGRHTDDDKERDRGFEAGKLAARNAIQLEPSKPDGHFWYAANLGEQANRSPITKGIKSVDEIRQAANKVIEIQPDYELASAYTILGQLELGTRMFGGSTEKAVEYFRTAIELGNENGDAHLNIAKAYLALNRPADARKHLEAILKMKPDPDYLPEYAQQLAEAKKLLETEF